ncbi:hypothetical protein HK405_005576 [Cladochytrium tenue]|nr:hypothetical protein HK405_005576 [Cladochytrium tenue]
MSIWSSPVRVSPVSTFSATSVLLKTPEPQTVCKKAFVKPFQRVSRFSVAPINYTLSLQAMSKEKLEFALPAVFTIGPKDEAEALTKYASLLADQAGSTSSSSSLEELVRGVIEGEMRVIAASLTIEEIFQDRKNIKDNIVHGVQTELDQFGLFIYNANIKQLHDSAGSEYFQYMRLKTHEGAVNQAKVDVAEARYKGDVGEAERKGKTRAENARIEAQTVIAENERQVVIREAKLKLEIQTKNLEVNAAVAKQEAENRAKVEMAETQSKGDIGTAAMAGKTRQEASRIEAEAVVQERAQQAVVAQAKARLELETTELDKRVRLARIEAGKQAEGREAELQAAVEVQQARRMQEKLRGEVLAAKKVEAEAIVAMADAKLYEQQRAADAALYAKSKEAEGNRLAFEAQAAGIRAIADAFGGNSAAVIQYLMIERGVYTQLAKANADAVRGLQPKLNVWTTGSGGDGASSSSGAAGDALQPIRNMQSIIPLIAGINQMTGIRPPTWIADVPPADGDVVVAPSAVGKAAVTNGARP